MARRKKHLRHPRLKLLALAVIVLAGLGYFVLHSGMLEKQTVAGTEKRQAGYSKKDRHELEQLIHESVSHD